MMQPRRTWRSWGALAVRCWCLAALIGACGLSAGAPVARPLATAPEPAFSPPAEPELPGTIVPLAGAPEGIVVTSTGTVAVNVREPDGLVILPISASGAASTRRFVTLGGSARHLTLGGPNGPALVADESDDQLVLVALPGGEVLSSVHVGRQPHEAFLVGRDTYWVSDELGNTFHIVRNGKIVRIVSAPLQPGGGAESNDGQYVVGVGVRARRITEYRADGTIVGSANCGAGPTHVTAGSDGIFWVNDTNGGAVLGFELTSRGPKQIATISTGAGSKPYGIAYDQARRTLWVTLTGRNELLGLTVQGTAIVHRSLRATVRQPNTVAADPQTGEVVVTGSTPDGYLQFLTGQQ